MIFTQVRIDVTDDLPEAITQGMRLSIAAWVFAPETRALVGGKPVVVSLLNGGTYDKRYFHFEVPGERGYSCAEALCQDGFIVVLLDHLGVGESSRAPTEKLVIRQIAAKANDAAVRGVYQRLRKGMLDSRIPALPDFLKVGGGHSMGAFQTITQQANHRTYDRVLILGYTAIGVHLTIGDQVVSADGGPIAADEADYFLHDRTRLHKSFHWDDVADHVIAVDDRLNVEVPCVLSRQSTMMGIVTEDAGKINAPVYICLGERDVSPDPHAEPGYYRSSPDVTLHILPRSGHCQNFATTRGEMYARIGGWIRSIDA
jgi:pimeloyl-ACP methyl ester carboxylesterase